VIAGCLVHTTTVHCVLVELTKEFIEAVGCLFWGVMEGMLVGSSSILWGASNTFILTVSQEGSFAADFVLGLVKASRTAMSAPCWRHATTYCQPRITWTWVANVMVMFAGQQACLYWVGVG
jgi:hypothetical protein